MISLDDFGTGYSSLSYLQRFPFDKIKIDRSFVSELMPSPAEAVDAPPDDDATAVAAKSAAMIVRAITRLGENLGIATTAEGVETVQQFARIRREGCTEVQGYFISPPQPANEVEALLRRLDTALPTIAAGPLFAAADAMRPIDARAPAEGAGEAPRNGLTRRRHDDGCPDSRPQKWLQPPFASTMGVPSACRTTTSGGPAATWPMHVTATPACAAAARSASRRWGGTANSSS